MESEPLRCDRVVDEFRAGADGDFPEGWETHPAASIDRAKREGLFRVVTLEGRRALHVRTSAEEIVLGRGIEDWDLEEYPFVEWAWRPSQPFPRQESAEKASQGVASVTAVWMIGLPFFVRRLGYTVGSHEPEGALRSERFGYDKWLTVGSIDAPEASLGAATWRRVRVNLLSDYRSSFERTDSDGPTGLSLAAHAGSTGAYFTDIRLCRRSASSAALTEGNSRKRTVP
jgi:hypothetical protein